MKNEKGITLMALIIYIILTLLVVAMLASISTMFFNNTEFLEESSKYAGEYNKFNMYFIEDVKKNNKVYSISETGNELVFIDGTTYVYQENAIYRDKVKICENITDLLFTKREDNTTGTKKEIVNVQIEINGADSFTADNDYVLKYW